MTVGRIIEAVQTLRGDDEDGWRALASDLMVVADPHLATTTVPPSADPVETATASAVELRREGFHALLAMGAVELEPLGSLRMESARWLVAAATTLAEDPRTWMWGKHPRTAKITVPGRDGDGRDKDDVHSNRELIVNVVFLASLVSGGDGLLAAVGGHTPSVDLIARAWSEGLHSRFLAYLKAEEEQGVAGRGATGVLATVRRLRAPRIDVVVGPVFSVLVPLAQDALTARRLAGLRAIRHVLLEAGVETIRWQEPALRGTLGVALRYRDAESCPEAVFTVCDAIRVLDGGRFKRIRTEGMDDSIQLHRLCLSALENLVDSGDEAKREAVASVLGTVVELTGQRIVLHLRKVLPMLLQLLETSASRAGMVPRDCSVFTSSIEATCLLFRIAWPRIPSHYAEVVSALCACVLRVRSSTSSEARFVVTNAAIDALVAARRCGATDAFDEALCAAVAELPELEPVQTAVKVRTEHDTTQPREGNPFGAFERVFFEAEGDVLPG